MIDWNIIQIAAYLGLFVGAPAVFFYFVSEKKQDDAAKALEKFYETVEKVAALQTAKLSQKLKETEALLAQKNAEWQKISPRLKYLREPSKGESSPKEGY